MTVPLEPDPGTAAPPRALRADARRNHEQILTVARDVLVERGPGAPLDEIAKRAGVGIGTLYRRFADRHALLQAVALDAVTQTSEMAEGARAEAQEPFGALTTYMHGVLDLRVSAVMPVLIDHIDRDEPQLSAARERGVHALTGIVEDAHADGSLRAEVAVGDVGLLLVRMSRPLPGPVPPDLNAELAHRHLDLLIDGMRTTRDTAANLTGPQLTFGDLHALQRD